MFNENAELIYNTIKECYAQLYPNMNVDEHLSYNMLAQNKGMSVAIIKQSVIRCTFFKDYCRVIIPIVYKSFLPNELQFYTMKSIKSSLCTDIINTEQFKLFKEYYKHVFEDMSSSDIGCCSYYNKCSDLRHCINTNPEIFPFCAYRKNLRDGKIFYGKNRNI